MRTFTVAILLPMLVAACSSNPVSSSTRCEVASTKPLQPGETSPLGFKPDQMFTPASGPRSGRLRWSKGGDTNLELQVTPISGFRYVDSVFVPGDTDIALQCTDEVQADATLSFKTADGAFDESFPVLIRAPAVSSVSMFVRIDPGSIHGSYGVTEADTTGAARVDLNLQLMFDGTRWSGSVRGGIEKDRGSTVEYRYFDVAYFGEGADFPDGG